jgi:hypothetical protein
MGSPFPGMDPYLEDASCWPAFQRHLVQSLSQLLTAGPMPRYHVRLGERSYTLDGAERREPFVEVRQRSDDRLVTGLEVVSPANKTTVPGRQAYLDQRRVFRSQGASLVEIDLVLQGQPLNEYGREGLPDWDYVITVTRSVQPDRFEIYTATLNKRLPRFRLPLASDDRDTVLDLQAATVHAYDLGDFTNRIDYRRDPPVKLSTTNESWLKELLARYRSSPAEPQGPVLSHDAIARVAYRLWEEAGRPEGRDQEHWYRAIKELKRAH